MSDEQPRAMARRSTAERARSTASVNAGPAVARAAFVARYGSIYENSPWVAERTYDRGAFDEPRDSRLTTAQIDRLATAMAKTVATASGLEKLALVRAHPDLVGRAALAGELTGDSTLEQASAGLDRCSPDELERFRALNQAYRARFGFPFVMAVRGLDRRSILDAFAARLAHEPEAELERALFEIDRIARLRLEALHRTAAD